jgi:hypothetical protein
MVIMGIGKFCDFNNFEDNYYLNFRRKLRYLMINYLFRIWITEFHFDVQKVQGRELYFQYKLLN